MSESRESPIKKDNEIETLLKPDKSFADAMKAAMHIPLFQREQIYEITNWKGKGFAGFTEIVLACSPQIDFSPFNFLINIWYNGSNSVHKTVNVNLVAVQRNQTNLFSFSLFVPEDLSSLKMKIENTSDKVFDFKPVVILARKKDGSERIIIRSLANT